MKAFKERNRGWLRWVGYGLGSLFFVFLLFCGCVMWEDRILANAKRDSEGDCRLVMRLQLEPNQALVRLSGYENAFVNTENMPVGIDKEITFHKDLQTIWLRSVSIHIEYVGDKPVGCEVHGFTGFL